MVTKMSEHDAKRLVNRAAQAGEGQWRDFEESFRQMLSKGFDSAEMPGSGGLDELKAVVRDLETRFLSLERLFSGGPKI